MPNRKTMIEMTEEELRFFEKIGLQEDVKTTP
jgi:hypothetical protein